MAECACTPGTPENGWHQKWCGQCLADEMARWSECIAKAADHG